MKSREYHVTGQCGRWCAICEAERGAEERDRTAPVWAKYVWQRVDVTIPLKSEPIIPLSAAWWHG